MKLAGRHLLQCCGVEYVIHTASSTQHTLIISNIANIELQFGAGVLLTHVILLLLVATEDADFSDISIKKTL
ncbi:hypothetical protein D3C84_1287890 [compost metagenome]